MTERVQRYRGFLEGLLGLDDDIEVVEEHERRRTEAAGETVPAAEPGLVVEERVAPPTTPPPAAPAEPPPERAAIPPRPATPRATAPPRPPATAGGPEPRAAPGPVVTPAELERRLDNPAPEQRASVLRELLAGEIGAGHVAVVARCLADPALEVRRLSVQVLEQASVAPDPDALASARHDPEPSIRSRVMHLVARTGDPRSLGWLAEAIRSDDDPDVVSAALMAVPRFLETVESASAIEDQIDGLLEAVGSAREQSQRFARELRTMASRLGPDRLAVALTRGRGWVRVGAGVLALASGEEGLQRVLASLADEADPLFDDLARTARDRLGVAAGGLEAGLAAKHGDRAARDRLGVAAEPGAAEVDEREVEGEGARRESRDEAALAPRTQAPDEAAPVPEPDGRPPRGAAHEAAAALIAGLDDPDPEVRRRCEEGLKQLSAERVLDWIAEAIHSEDEEDLERVARVAASVRCEAAVPLLADRVLALPAGTARSAAISALRQFETTRDLVGTWGASDDPVRRARAVRLASILNPFSIDEALAALGDRSPQVRLVALDVLSARLSDEVAPHLLRVIDSDASAEVRAAAVRSFADASAELRIRAASQGLKDTDAAVRRSAVGVLRAANHGEIALLVEALTDVPDVAADAARKLAAGGTGEDLVTLWGAVVAAGGVGDEVLGVLLGFDGDALLRVAHQSLTSVRADERALAVAVLRRLPNVDVTELTAGLTDPSSAVRAEILAACIEHPDARVLEHVAGRLRDPVGSIRVLAARALSRIDDDWALPHLLEACRDPLEEVREEARRAVDARRSPAVVRLLVDHLETAHLGRVAADLLEAMAPDVVDLLVAALDDAGPGLRRALGDVLTRSGQLEALLQQLDDVAPDRRRRAVQALASSPSGARFAERIAALLGDPDPAVRVAVAEALGEMRTPSVVEALKRAFVDDPDMNVVAAVERALRRLTGREAVDEPDAAGDDEEEPADRRPDHRSEERDG